MLAEAYARASSATMGPVVARLRPTTGLRIALLRARLGVRAEEHLARHYFGTLVAALVMTGLAVAAWRLAATGAFSAPLAALVLVSLFPLVVVILGVGMAHMLPGMIADSRRNDIEMHLPSAISYIATMAGAGTAPERIFSGLAKQRVYGEVATEAAWIARDMRVLGMDIVTALGTAIDRSPSPKLQDFLQGAITVITSGGELKEYFLAKSEQYLIENRHEQRRFLDSVSVLAESYVTVVVAGPVFMIILISVMLMFGNGSANLLTMGYALILIFIPLAQVAFGLSLRHLTPKVV